MHVVILERNKLVGRKVARLFMATGATAQVLEEPAGLAAAVETADMLCADASDGALVAELVRARPALRGVLWTSEPLKQSLHFMVETAEIDHLLGRRDSDSSPRPWEILMTARRGSLSAPAPLSAYLDWGAYAIELEVRSTADRDAAVARMHQVGEMLAVPRRIGEMFGELGHELIMNAMYDAPVDARGQPRYEADRKAAIVLEAHERAVVRIGTDGSRLALQVRDPFGRLERHHVFGGLARGLAGEMDRSHGGAGLGMAVCHNASSAMFFDVSPGRHTDVTALFELDQNLREFRTQARSLHFWRR
ncbi:MAG TPA: ATP-binding protein [Kofleriaceae bacterium]|nr:ATP-binding protein [Kofleriaceae bacterium]